MAPGAKTRYDDFVATHINQTLSIHGTVSAADSEKETSSDLSRATSSRGIDTSPGHMSRHSEKSVGTRGRSLTIAGQSGQPIRPSLQSSMAVI